MLQIIITIWKDTIILKTKLKNDWLYQKKVDQNKITTNFLFVIDIIFIKLFLNLMFSGGNNKTIGVLITTLVKIFTYGKK